MPANQVNGIRVAGIASAVPEPVQTVDDAVRTFGDAALKISESTGVRIRHVAPPEVCSSDLCFAAAERLLREMEWPADSIDLLIFVSQTPDHIAPATACILQGRLGLSKSCAAFDVNLGCSGYVYGLWMASSLLAAGGGKRALLLCGDTARKQSPEDRSVAMLFGDAGTATALESGAAEASMSFVLGTDGANYQHLIIPAGGFRTPLSGSTGTRTVGEDGNVRSLEDVYMNGPEIFAFTLREVPAMCRKVLENAAWPQDSVDAFVMHQANRFMLQHLAKKMKVPLEKLPITLDEFGNTSSASIPITLTQRLGDPLRNGTQRLLLAGFGVGLSFAAATVQCEKITIPQLTIVNALPEQARGAA